MSEQFSLSEAIGLYKEGKIETSLQLLHNHLKTTPEIINTLLWIAKISNNTHEKLAAAELALALEPENEIAKRAVAAVQQSPTETSILQPIDLMRVTGMTESQARAVIWPFRGLNRPMGVLLDEGKIGIGDLRYAIEKANSIVQQAARTLFLIHALGDTLKDPPAPLTFIKGSDYTGFRERSSRALSGLFLGIGISFLLVGSLAAVLGIMTGQTAFIIVAYLIFGLAFLGEKLTDKFDRNAEQFKLGRDAEQKAIDNLRASLSSPWVLIHNLEWPDRHWGDIDVVLLGTGGIWALEVKAYQFPVRNRGDQWEYKSRLGWRTMSKHPGKQAKTNATNLKNYLESKGLPIRYVKPVVVWAGDENLLQIQDPTVPIWKLSEIPERIEEFWREQKLDNEQIQKCANVLKQLVAQMQEKNSKQNK